MAKIFFSGEEISNNELISLSKLRYPPTYQYSKLVSLLLYHLPSRRIYWYSDQSNTPYIISYATGAYRMLFLTEAKPWTKLILPLKVRELGKVAMTFTIFVSQLPALPWSLQQMIGERIDDLTGIISYVSVFQSMVDLSFMHTVAKKWLTATPEKLSINDIILYLEILNHGTGLGTLIQNGLELVVRQWQPDLSVAERMFLDALYRKGLPVIREMCNHWNHIDIHGTFCEMINEEYDINIVEVLLHRLCRQYGAVAMDNIFIYKFRDLESTDWSLLKLFIQYGVTGETKRDVYNEREDVEFRRIMLELNPELLT